MSKLIIRYLPIERLERLEPQINTSNFSNRSIRV